VNLSGEPGFATFETLVLALGAIVDTTGDRGDFVTVLPPLSSTGGSHRPKSMTGPEAHHWSLLRRFPCLCVVTL
jgi:hypothetical protein